MIHNCLTTEIFTALILKYREMTERPSRFLGTISIQNSKYGLTMSQFKQNSFQKNSYKVVSVFSSILKYFTLGLIPSVECFKSQSQPKSDYHYPVNVHINLGQLLSEDHSGRVGTNQEQTTKQYKVKSRLFLVISI